MTDVSSRDLHPSAGARFVFDREGDAPSYRLEVFLPEGRRASAALGWDVDGKAVFAWELAPQEEDAWVRDGAGKLARVLKRDPKAKLSRWRDR